MEGYGVEITPGTVIRYPGDVCNHPARMVVTRTYVNRWGVSFDAVELDDTMVDGVRREFNGEPFSHIGEAPQNWKIEHLEPSRVPPPRPGSLASQKVIYEEARPSGFYFATDDGANVAGVCVIARRCRKPKYIATAVTEPSSIRQRIERHENPRPPPPFGVPIPLSDLMH